MKRKSLHGLRLAIVLLIALPILISSRTPHHTSEAQGGGTPILYGANVYGAIAAGAPPSLYVFSGDADDLVIVEVVPLTPGFAPTLDLVAPDGQVLVSAQPDRMGRHSQNAHLAQFLALSGNYTLAVNGRDGIAGNYMLRLKGRSAVLSVPLQYDVPLDVAVPEDATPQFFTFQAEDCPTTLVLTNAGSGDPFTFPFAARVRDETGQAIALLRGGDAQEGRITVAANSGRYEVEVLSDDPTTSGNVTLQISCAGDAQGCAGGGDELACLPCPSCPNAFDGGTLPVCPVMALSVDEVDDEEDGLTVIRWNAVPDTNHYWIHIYGYNDEGEIYLGTAGAPGDATELIMGHLFEGFSSFRFVIEAIQGEEVVCTDETEIVRALSPCPAMNVAFGATDEGATLTWTAVPGTDHYLIHFYGLSEDGETYLGAAGAPGDATEFSFDHLPPGYSVVRFLVEAIPSFCSGDTIILEITPLDPCALRTDRGDIRVHVGPGRHRGVFAFLPPGEDILIVGRAYDDEGNLWWEIDKTRIPGHEAATSLWVMANDVMESGNCDNVPEGDIPPLHPSDDPDQTGGWGACGSCDTCGHAGECVTTPEGACVWDPATCAGQPPPDDDNNGGQPSCLTVGTAVDPSGTGSVSLSKSNCGEQAVGNYLQGTTVNARAHPNGGCWLDHWSGCGTSGNASPISFVVNSSCVITAHIQCIE